MTPFDPAALLAMLLAFYLPATPENVARAMRERPEYFAGGSLIGHSGDALRLPDGRIFDLIYDVDNATGNRHYQVIIPGGAGAPDPFPLEDGPLRPIDPATFAFPLPKESFVDLVAGALDDVGAHQTRIDTGYTMIVEHSAPTRIQASSALDLEPAAAAHGVHLARFNDADPVSVIAATHAQGGALAGGRGDYDDPDPGTFTPVDPGPIPSPGVGEPPAKD